MTVLKPFTKRVLVKPIKEEEKTSNGGIIIPSLVKEQVKRGIIKAVGAEVDLLKEGDTILYSATAGTEITIDNEAYLLMFADPNEILAVI
jgi:chaperonin GroES